MICTYGLQTAVIALYASVVQDAEILPADDCQLEDLARLRHLWFLSSVFIVLCNPEVNPGAS